MESWFFYIIVAAIAYFFGKSSMTPKVEAAENNYKETIDKLNEMDLKLNDTTRKFEELSGIYDQTLADLYNDSVLLPSLARWAKALQKIKDDGVVNYLKTKKHPAMKGAEVAQLAKREARERKKELDIALNRVDLYESLAPWLIEHTEVSLHDLLESIREDIKQQDIYKRDEDPASLYVLKSEWLELSETNRNQLALDRYCNPRRKRSPWSAGIEYERYVGYLFERKGYQVEYQGALRGKEDLGIDLICQNNSRIYIVQCKRLSAVKQLPVRENVVAQVYGSARFYQMDKDTEKTVFPMIVTSYELSGEAKRFAEYLGVQFNENRAIKSYPMIKCNISRRDGEKIYHLPIDQQYDRVIINDVDGEFYAKTVIEAEGKGFRRAFRWKGVPGAGENEPDLWQDSIQRHENSL